MTKFQAGYLIDEVFDLFFKQKGYEDLEKAIAEFSIFCYFELAGLEDFELNESTESFDKVLLIAYNIINRGTPTRASLFITEKILSQYGYQIKKTLSQKLCKWKNHSPDLQFYSIAKYKAKLV